MNDYQPKSRRPIADVLRATATLSVSVCVRLGIHPDAVSYASIAAAAGAGVCFWRARDFPLLLVAGAVLCAVRLWLNMLDGMVALASGKASLRGEIVNELPDRFSDVLIFVGVAHSELCHVASGYWAAITALITAYVGMLGQAVGATRQFGGVMSKPWRMAVLMAGAVVALCLPGDESSPAVVGALSVLDIACLAVVVGCVQTIWVRLARILRELGEKAAG